MNIQKIIIINVICNHFKKYNKTTWINLYYGCNIFNKNLIYSKYTPSVSIISKPFNVNYNP
jgi:hypothetical protein